MVSNGNAANLVLNKIREYLNSGEPSCSEGEKNLRHAFFFEMLYFNLWEENNRNIAITKYPYFSDFNSVKTTMEAVVQKARKPKHQWFIPGGCLNYVLKTEKNQHYLCELGLSSFNQKKKQQTPIVGETEERQNQVNKWLKKTNFPASDPLITWWKRTHASVSENSSEDSSSSSIYRIEVLSDSESSSSSVRKHSSITLSDDDDSQPIVKKQCVEQLEYDQRIAQEVFAQMKEYYEEEIKRKEEEMNQLKTELQTKSSSVRKQLEDDQRIEQEVFAQIKIFYEKQIKRKEEEINQLKEELQTKKRDMILSNLRNTLKKGN